RMPPRPDRRVFWTLLSVFLAVAVALGAYEGLKYRADLAPGRDIAPSAVTLYNTDYWMGELVESIVERGEYRGCYPSTLSAQPATVGLCFSAHRMPVVPLFMALVAKVYKSVPFFVIVKTALLMLLLCIAMWQLVRDAPRRWMVGCLLAVV